MKRSELKRLKDAVTKGTALEGFDVLPRPKNRNGFLWIPLYNADTAAIGWQEIPDPDHKPVGSGDYTDPVMYVQGMSVMSGLFYTDGEDIWEAIGNGVPKNFTDKSYFDVIEV